VLALPREAPPDRPPGLDAVGEALEREAPPPRGDDAELLHAIYEALDDDGPRLVYADALLERGDPRGELISLQCRGATTAAQRQRERQLVMAHGKAWLGELAPILRATFRFERGFLAACEVDTKKLELVKKLAGHTAWSTVRELAGSARIGLHPVMRSLRRLEFSSPGARGNEQLVDAWRDLLEETERPLEELAFQVSGANVWDHQRQMWIPSTTGELDALARCTALPKLRSLEVGGPPEAVLAVLAGPVADRLESFTAAIRGNDRNGLDPLWAELGRARFAKLRIVLGLDHATELTVERGERAYIHAHLVVGPTMRVAGNWSASLASTAVGMLQQLPPTIATIRLTKRKNLLDDDFARVRATAEARGAKSVEID
jgi:uncharacterized protein (TIGR02996 family)